jgi:hypothetical protein
MKICSVFLQLLHVKRRTDRHAKVMLTGKFQQLWDPMLERPLELLWLMKYAE